jgi:hypothetical protein
MSDARAVVDKAQSEADFQAQIVELAESLGWYVCHNADSRRTRAGVPDLELLRGPVMMRWEIKKEDGVVTDAQQAYVDRLNQVDLVYAAVIRPSHLPAAKDALERAVR